MKIVLYISLFLLVIIVVIADEANNSTKKPLSKGNDAADVSTNGPNLSQAKTTEPSTSTTPAINEDNSKKTSTVKPKVGHGHPTLVKLTNFLYSTDQQDLLSMYEGNQDKNPVQNLVNDVIKNSDNNLRKDLHALDNGHIGLNVESFLATENQNPFAAPPKVNSKSSADGEDPDGLFLLSLVPYLDAMPNLQKLDVRQKIQTAVINAYQEAVSGQGDV